MAIKNTDMLDNIDRQIEELYVKRAEIETQSNRKREKQKRKRQK